MNEGRNQPGPVELKTERYTLVPFTEEQITDRYLGWLNDPEVNRFLEVRHEQSTRESTLPFVASFYGPIEKYMWGIHVGGEAEPIGTSTLYDIKRRLGSAEIGLMIGEPDHWGQGASDAAIGMIASFAFDQLGLRRLTASSYTCNHGINFTLRRFGFAVEGRMREAFILSEGRYVDAFRWGLLSAEWKPGGRG